MKRFLLLLTVAFLAIGASAAEFKAVAVRVQFSDRSFSGDDAAASNLLLKAQSYLNAQFRGEHTFSFELGPVVTLSGTLSQYGANVSGTKDKLLYQGLRQACSLSDGQVDFSKYDNDGNGDVDLLLFIVAGQSEARGAGEEYVWPAYSNFGKHYVALPFFDGKQLNRYVVCTEIVDNVPFGDVGTLCHEFGHYLGLPDFYDTDGEYSGGISKGLYGTSLMDGGSFVGALENPSPMNAVESYLLGIGTPKTLEPGRISLGPLEDTGEYYVFDGPTEGEKYFFENRKSKGLMIYHYDRSSNRAGKSNYYRRELTAAERWTLDEVNCCPNHECLSLVAPSPSDSLYCWPTEHHKSFGSGTSPAFSFWNGAYSPFCLTEMTFASDVVSFNVVRPLEVRSFAVFQESAFLNFAVDGTLGEVRNCSLNCLSSDGMVLSGLNPVKTDKGEYMVKFSGLSPNLNYSYELKVKTDEGEYALTDNFRTKVRLQGTCPYIVVPDNLRNADGSLMAGARLPLVLMNATGVDDVVWYLNGERIEAGNDGCLVLNRSGELRALVSYSSGKTDVLKKILTVR